MELVTQILFGILSFLNTDTQGVCMSNNLTSQVISLFVNPDMCLKEDAPTWKYLYKLVDYYQLTLHTLRPFISLAVDCFIYILHSLAGWRDTYYALYLKYSNILINDQIFMIALKVCSLLLFLFIMHWLKQSSLTNPETALRAPTIKSPGNGHIPNDPSLADTTLTPQTIICEFEFKTPTELRAEAEAVNVVMLDVEEKRRGKRFSKKRKCVSAGPVLIHLRQNKKRKNPQPYIVAMLPPVEARDHYLPLRSKPLAVGSEKLKPIIVNNIETDLDETEIMAYMCVYKFRNVLFL